jgi:hypothetical protein
MKAEGAITTRSAGMQNDESDEQFRNAESSIRESLESDLSVTVESSEQESKQFEQRISTEEGMQIDESDEQLRNARSSIRQSVGSDSNATVTSFEHRSKQ